MAPKRLPLPAPLSQFLQVHEVQFRENLTDAFAPLHGQLRQPPHVVGVHPGQDDHLGIGVPFVELDVARVDGRQVIVEVARLEAALWPSVCD